MAVIKGPVRWPRSQPHKHYIKLFPSTIMTWRIDKLSMIDICNGNIRYHNSLVCFILQVERYDICHPLFVRNACTFVHLFETYQIMNWWRQLTCFHQHLPYCFTKVDKAPLLFSVNPDQDTHRFVCEANVFVLHQKITV